MPPKSIESRLARLEAGSKPGSRHIVMSAWGGDDEGAAAYFKQVTGSDITDTDVFAFLCMRIIEADGTRAPLSPGEPRYEILSIIGPDGVDQMTLADGERKWRPGARVAAKTVRGAENANQIH